MNPIILPGHRNLVNAEFSPTLTGTPTLVSGLPITNLQTGERFRVARSVDLTAQVIDYTWPSNQTANMFADRFCNYTGTATRRVQVYSDTARTTQIADSGTVTVFPFTGFSANDVLTDADFKTLKNSAFYFPTVTTMRALRVTYTDGSPANGDGYQEWSRHFIGKYFELSRNIMWGAEPMQIVDLGKQSRANDGSLISAKGPKARKWVLDLADLRESDWPEMLSLTRGMGLDKDGWFSLYPGRGDYLEAYNQAAVKIGDASDFSRHFPGTAKQRLTLVET